MGTIKGLDCEVFKRTAASSYATPSYTAIGAVRDASYEFTYDEVDASRRGSGGWKQTETTLRDATASITMVKDKDDTMFVELQAAAQAGTAVELVMFDGVDASGSEGLDAMWYCTSWEEGQDLEGIVQIEAEFKVAPDTDLTPTFIADALPTSRS